MTDGLGLWDVYAANMERKMAYAGGKSRFEIGALTRISQAAVEGGFASPYPCSRVRLVDFNAGNIHSIITLVGCCQGLISLDKNSSE